MLQVKEGSSSEPGKEGKDGPPNPKELEVTAPPGKSSLKSSLAPHHCHHDILCLCSAAVIRMLCMSAITMTASQSLVCRPCLQAKACSMFLVLHQRAVRSEWGRCCMTNTITSAPVTFTLKMDGGLVPGRQGTVNIVCRVTTMITFAFITPKLTMIAKRHWVTGSCENYTQSHNNDQTFLLSHLDSQ